jgi:hypothetical protein
LSLGEYGENHADAPFCKEQSQRSSERSQQHTFGEQLPDQSLTARADGETHSDFPLPGGCSREKQVGCIHTGNQKCNTDYTQRDFQFGGEAIIGFRRSSWAGFEFNPLSPDFALGFRGRLGSGCFEPHAMVDHVEISAVFGDNAGFQACHNPKRVMVLQSEPGMDEHRWDNICRPACGAQAKEMLRSHSEDGEWSASQSDRFPDD